MAQLVMPPPLAVPDASKFTAVPAGCAVIVPETCSTPKHVAVNVPAPIGRSRLCLGHGALEVRAAR